MAVRDLMFKINFKGDTNPLEKANGATDKLKKNAQKAGKAITEMGDRLKKTSKTVTDFGGGLNKKLTLPIVGLGVAGVKMVMDLEKGLKKVSTLADKDILPIDKLKSGIKEISSISGIAQTEISESVYSALSAGVESANVMDFVKSNIALTRAGFTDMETAIDGTTTVLNAYGKNAFKVDKIHDIFVKTQDKGKISVDELAKSLGRIVPTAADAGVNLDQLGASYAILTAKGQPAELATTNLNAMLAELSKTGSASDLMLKKLTGKGFTQLTKEGKNVGQILELLGKGATDADLTLKDMFGSTSAGAAAVTLLSDGASSYTDMLKEMNNSQGLTAQNAENNLGTMDRMKIMFNDLKIGLMELADVIMPVVEPMVAGISDMAKKFSNLDDKTKQNIVKFALLAAAIGPVIMVVGKVVGAIGGAVTVIGTIIGAIGVVTTGAVVATPAIAALAAVFAFMVSPIGLVIAALAALVAIGVAVYKNFDKIKEGWNKLVGAFKKPAKGTVDITERKTVFNKTVASKAETLEARAKGDSNWRGGLVQVHEKGGEILDLPTGTRIYPHDKSVSMAREEGVNRGRTTQSNSFSPTIQITVEGNADNATVQNLETTIKRILAREQQSFWNNLNLQQA